ncbi:MAG: apolipoprotein N-acyltransferase [Candidatus Aminicenantales bacterium]
MKIKLRDIGLALLCGIATALALPKFSLSFLAWISLLPLFFIVLGKTPKQSFFLGLLAGTVFYGILLVWIPSVPRHYGNISLELSLLIYLIFILFLGLFWAIFWYLFTRLHRAFPRTAFYLAPFIWVSLEFILTYFLTGFPWALLGSSQYKNILFIQLASLTGVYGLSFVLIFLQSMFTFSMAYRKKAPFFLGLGLILMIHLGGFLSLKDTPRTHATFKASVIQGNVPSDIYWNEISTNEILTLFEDHLSLSQLSYLQGAQLIIWPEFTVPLCFSCPEDLYRNFKRILIQFVQNTQCTLLLGTNEISVPPGDIRYFNTALCLNPGLSITFYHKIHLVPFGEYTPYKKIFSFIEKVTHAIGEITPGTEYTLHSFNNLKFGSPICYEIIFPNLVRKFVKTGAHFLVTITNDGWYGKSSAPYQHFTNAIFRAVENRRYLLRAATTGISGIIDPYGRVVAQSQIGTKTFLTESITPRTKKTFYTLYGDLLPLAGLTLTSLFFILSLIKRKNELSGKRYRRPLI